MAINYRQLAYTTPNGERIEFPYDGALEDGVTHNLGTFQFSGVDGNYYQDRSLTTDAYPFEILLNSQEDLSVVRRAFLDKKTENKTGYLEHPDPTLGTFPVVVASTKVTQNSVKGQGIIIVSVVFYKTIENLLGGNIEESSNPSSGFAMATAIDELNIEQATDFENAVNLDEGSGFSALVNRATEAVTNVQDGLSFIAAQVDEVNILFTNTGAEILGNIEELARSPFDLARQIQNLIQLPMLAIDDATTRISAYKEYVESVLTFTASDEAEFNAGSSSGKNILAVAGLASLAGISAINYSAVSTPSVTLDEIVSGEEVTTTTTAVATSTLITEGYFSRTQIMETIQSVLTTAYETTETLSEKAANFNGETFFTQYFDYSILNKNIVSATVKNLNKRIFNTAREVIFVTDEEKTPIEYCALVYNSVEVNTINFFITSNKLHGDEIFIIPKGREVVYYV